MEKLAPIFSLLSLLSMIFASLVKGKKMKLILFLVCCGNVFGAIAFLLEGTGIEGAASCFFGGFVTIINFFFEARNKKVPKPLTFVYGIGFTLINVAVNLATGGFDNPGKLDIACLVIAIVACWMFVMCIGQENGSRYRFWTILNMALWCTYDILTCSYSVLVSHVLQLVFPIVGKVLLDGKKDKKEKE